MLCRLIYYSTSAPGVTPPDIDAILAVSQANNLRRNVTGVLAWDGRFFVQILEGHRMTLTDLVGRIQQDRRNRNMVLVSLSEVDRRRFSGWAMADMSDCVAVSGASSFEPYTHSAADLEAIMEEAICLALPKPTPASAGSI